MRPRFLWAAALLLLPGVASAYPTVTFSASDGVRKASATFTQNTDTNQLIIQLANTATVQATNNNQILLGLFFDIVNQPTLGKVSALIGPTSDFVNNPTSGPNIDNTANNTSDPNYRDVGGEWVYKFNASGLSTDPLRPAYGLASAGYNIFGPGDTFNNFDRNNRQAPDGGDYGIAPLAGVGSQVQYDTLIRNTVIFTLSLPTGTTFEITDISNVGFQYGTSLDEPYIVPEPSALAIAGLGALGFLGYGLRRRLRV